VPVCGHGARRVVRTRCDLMGRKDRMTFRLVVPRAVRHAARVFTVSERTKTDIVELYAVPAERIVVTPNGVDRSLLPGPGSRDYVLSVGAIQARRTSSRRSRAATAVGLPLVVVGPTKGLGARIGAARRGRATRGLRRDDAARRTLSRSPRASSSRAATRASGSQSSRRWLGHAGRRRFPTAPSRKCPRRGRARRRGRPRGRHSHLGARRAEPARRGPGTSAPRRSAGGRPPSGRLAGCTGRLLGLVKVSAVVAPPRATPEGAPPARLRPLLPQGRRDGRDREPPWLGGGRACRGSESWRTRRPLSLAAERQPRHRGDERGV
jgi:hypothetical protein